VRNVRWSGETVRSAVPIGSDYVHDPAEDAKSPSLADVQGHSVRAEPSSNQSGFPDIPDVAAADPSA